MFLTCQTGSPFLWRSSVGQTSPSCRARWAIAPRVLPSASAISGHDIPERWSSLRWSSSASVHERHSDDGRCPRCRFFFNLVARSAMDAQLRPGRAAVTTSRGEDGNSMRSILSSSGRHLRSREFLPPAHRISITCRKPTFHTTVASMSPGRWRSSTHIPLTVRRKPFPLEVSGADLKVGSYLACQTVATRRVYTWSTV